jgi:hypothetical protein
MDKNSLPMKTLLVSLAVAVASVGTTPRAEEGPRNDPASIVSLTGNFVSYQLTEPYPHGCSENVKDFVLHVDDPIGIGEFALIRFVWQTNETPPPKALERADRSWRLTVVRDPNCDATIDELRWDIVVSTNGGSPPPAPHFGAAAGLLAREVPPGTRLTCYELHSRGLQ